MKYYTLESLMDQIRVVFQNVYLFADTIENNIKFGRPDATHDEVVAAAKEACCDDFIEALPDGYNTVIGDGGASISGGEKQRVAVARALILDPCLILADEPTGNLDPANREIIISLLRHEHQQGRGIILITHDDQTAKAADTVLRLEGGFLHES